MKIVQFLCFDEKVLLICSQCTFIFIFVFEIVVLSEEPFFKSSRKKSPILASLEVQKGEFILDAHFGDPNFLFFLVLYEDFFIFFEFVSQSFVADFVPIQMIRIERFVFCPLFFSCKMRRVAFFQI